MRLHALLNGLVDLLPSENPNVLGLARDSRRVRPGHVFVAVPGTRVDGAAFAAQAVQRGAVAVVAERDLPGLGVPVVRVPRAARALGVMADRFEGRPSRQVAVSGVTGTNGKTTTTCLLASILEASGRPVSLLGTVQNRVGGVARDATMTTPDAIDLQRAIAETKRAGARDLVMEVSSHALDQDRVAGVRFASAVFTNLTRDHLDYHGSLKAYGLAKARLFEQLPEGAPCVLNARDPFSRTLAARTRGRVLFTDWTLGKRPISSGVAVSARILKEGLEGSWLEIAFDGHAFVMRLPLVGRFNVENALGAAAAAWGLGVSAEAVVSALATCRGVPGRLERVSAGATPTVLVDYAHTPDALERVLATLRPLTPGRLLVVFGCGGDRDRGKRATMGAVVERLSDLAFPTSDNPRSEDPSAILSEVLAGFDAPGRAHSRVDRREAIEAAIGAAVPGDLVLIAGKGHEQGQIVGGCTIPFDDRQVARAILRAA